MLLQQMMLEQDCMIFNFTTNMGNDDYCITVGVSETTATDGATNSKTSNSIDGDGSTTFRFCYLCWFKL